MIKKNISVGIDIGSSKVTICSGTIGDNCIDILATAESENSGTRKGAVVDVEETVSSISTALEEIERMTGDTIHSATIGVNGAHIQSESGHGTVVIGKSDGEISDSDVERVIEASKAVPNQPNREILHVIPKTYIIDGQENSTDPSGMAGVRLEVNTNIITGSISAIKNTVKSINQAGLDISELVFSPLATEKFLLTKQQKEIGVAIIDIGASTTSYAIYEECELIHCGVIPVGSGHITNDIAIGLRTNINLAEILKLKYGYASLDQVDEKDEVDLAKIDKNETGIVNVRYITEIIEARLNELFILIRDELSTINRDGMLPAGVVLTGGGSKLVGINLLAKNLLRLPVETGHSEIKFSGVVDNLNNPVYATSAGLMLWGLRSATKNKGKIFETTDFGNMFDKVRRTFRNFLP